MLVCLLCDLFYIYFNTGVPHSVLSISYVLLGSVLADALCYLVDTHPITLNVARLFVAQLLPGATPGFDGAVVVT